MLRTGSRHSSISGRGREGLREGQGGRRDKGRMTDKGQGRYEEVKEIKKIEKFVNLIDFGNDPYPNTDPQPAQRCRSCKSFYQRYRFPGRTCI
jgi:hypothetical protein